MTKNEAIEKMNNIIRALNDALSVSEPELTTNEVLVNGYLRVALKNALEVREDLLAN